MHDSERMAEHADRARPRPQREPQEQHQDPSAHDRLLGLQTSAGNRATAAFVQPLLRVGTSGDAWEREADRVAEAVTGGAATAAPTAAPALVQRLAGGHDGDGATLDALTTAEIRSASTQGAPLPATVRRSIEPVLGADLSTVRVHADGRADALADRIGAKAFTHGRDVFFAQGEYRPGSTDGLRTIAHEATHVVQQGAGGAAPSVQRLKNPLRQLKKLKNSLMGTTNVIGDTEVKSAAHGPGGSANEVSKLKLKDSGVGGSKDAYFKAHSGGAPSQNAVASSRLARGLGMGDAIARNKFGNVGGKAGAVSGGVKGVPLKEERYDVYIGAFGEIDPDAALMNDWKQMGGPTGGYYGRSGTDVNDIDFRNPETQKGMADLQVLDAISGQVDRHGGNLFVDPKTGKVTGIDDDMAFKLGHTNKSPGDKFYSADIDGLIHGNDNFLGLPSQVDAGTAAKILAMDPSSLPKLLRRPGDPKSLTDAELDAAKKRLVRVQEHVRKLADDDKLIGTWDDSTYDQAMAEADRVTVGKANAKADEKSYLKRAANMLGAAKRGDTVDGVRYGVKGADGPVYGPEPDPTPKPKPKAGARPRLDVSRKGKPPTPPKPLDPETARRALAEVGVLAAEKGKQRKL